MRRLEAHAGDTPTCVRFRAQEAPTSVFTAVWSLGASSWGSAVANSWSMSTVPRASATNAVTVTNVVSVATIIPASHIATDRSQATMGFGAKHTDTRHIPTTRGTSTSLHHHTVESCCFSAFTAGMPDPCSTFAFTDAVATGIPAANIAIHPATTSPTVSANY